LELDLHHPGDRSNRAHDKARSNFDIAELTRQLVDGNEMAYRTFHETYCFRLSRYLLVIASGNEQATRDALQETYRRVVRHIRIFSDEATFWSWLTVLARSAFADEGRKRRRYLAFLDHFRHHVAIAPARLANDPLGESLEHHLSCLPVDERALLEAKYSERQPVREIATRLEITEKAVESRLTRIREKLRQAVLADLKHDP
jgi:RNA polymerase sigma-70 factor (ECF subfamily)